MSTISSVRREILVDADLQTAFEVFTARVGQWWPLEEHSVYGAGATVAFEDGRIIERSADGQAAVWGTVTRWEPPAAVAFSWHPGQSAERASRVEVTFAAADGRTLVTLEHAGWEVYADPAAARAEYDQGWPAVLDGYREFAAGHAAAAGSGTAAGRAAAEGSRAAAGSRTAAADGQASEDEDEDTWVALLHRPGPSAPADGTLFSDPRFADHVAFLNRMREAGYLVAAGPMPDAAGEGMTILRLPGAGQLGTATRLATEDDASVVAGLLAVTVRPWLVFMETVS